MKSRHAEHSCATREPSHSHLKTLSASSTFPQMSKLGLGQELSRCNITSRRTPKGGETARAGSDVSWTARPTQLQGGPGGFDHSKLRRRSPAFSIFRRPHAKGRPVSLQITAYGYLSRSCHPPRGQGARWGRSMAPRQLEPNLEITSNHHPLRPLDRRLPPRPAGESQLSRPRQDASTAILHSRHFTRW